ncbi:MAG: M28 family peptidase [Candidatus Marinimicrobia bacterium]|nr:M28 family peptidase [Candidatus Neomarinimicrobiota bacterium]
MKKSLVLLLCAVLTSFMLGNCASRLAIKAGQDVISMDRYTEDLVTLASDEFQGRKPGTPGGAMTVRYLVERFERLGLEPGNGRSYLQEVPLMAIIPDTQATLIITGAGVFRELAYGDDFLGQPGGYNEEVRFDSTELVFVGYGVVAPEYDWDDYADVNVDGKLVVILRGDPGFATGDTTRFRGTSRTSHAFFASKYRQAGEHGARGAFVIIDPKLSSNQSNWTRFKRRGTRSRTKLEPDGEDTPGLEVEGYLNLSTGRSILALAGLDYDSLVTAAAQPGFRSVPLGLRVSGSIRTTIRHFTSHNVMARLTGTKRPDEWVIYTAHWDHEGMDSTLAGDQIYNGAADNATGTASILSLAEVFAGLDQPPERSILFMGFTAEESGLLGSRYYVNHPVYPLIKTVTVINIDMLVPLGQTHDIIIIGHGKSVLDKYVARAAKRLGMVVQPDLWPERNFYFRSDHINFAREGVPALNMTPGMDHVVYGQDSTLARFDDFIKEKYHQVSDEFDASWDLAGIRDYLRIAFDVGYTISNQTRFPNWYRGDEFRPIRDAAMDAAGSK